MKKASFLFIVILSLIFSAITVTADEYDAELDVAYNYDSENESIVINASIVNIKDESGIILVTYDIYYDETILELVGTNVKMPDSWKPYLETEMAEDFSKNNGNGSFCWSVLNAASNCGITEDNQFFVELTFKPLKKEKTDIAFQCVHLANDNVEKLNGNDVILSIDLTAPETPDINNDAKIENSDNSNANGQESVIDSSNSVSNDNVSSKVSLDNATNDANNEKDNSSSAVTIVIIAFILIAVVSAVCLVNARKGKKL